MRNVKWKYSILMLVILTLSSCSHAILNFAVLSPYVSNSDIDKSKGVLTEGKSVGISLNLISIDEAMYDALKNAGSKYDMLIDGVVRFEQYPFVVMYVVKGTAISSKDLKASLGEKGFETWCCNHKILIPNK